MTLRVSHFTGFNDTNGLLSLKFQSIASNKKIGLKTNFSSKFLNLEPIYGFPLISCVNNLRILDVSANFEDINNESVSMIIKNCNKLEELVLRLNPSVTDQSIALIPQYLSNLRKLCALNSNVRKF